MRTTRLSHLFGLALTGAALLALGAAREAPLSSEELMRRGDAAFAAGDFAAAAELFGQAADRADDPGPATYNQALANYRLALLAQEPNAGLKEAAVLFRCCLAADDPRRPQALYGLANCLLHGPAGADGANLRRAIENYRACLKAVAHDSALARDARENLELAELLLSQYVPPASPPEDDPSGDKDTQTRPDRLPLVGPDDGGSDGGTETADPGKGEQKGTGDGMEKRGQNGNPGSPTTPPTHDDQGAPRTAGEAANRIDAAVKAILDDRRANLLKSRPVPPDNVDDW
jgi:tetratricopeptide (TPR) repeat protein